MAIGTVKWFNKARGMGCTDPDDGSADLLAHYSENNMSGFKALKKGQKVSFEVTTKGPKGKRASNIMLPIPETFNQLLGIKDNT